MTDSGSAPMECCSPARREHSETPSKSWTRAPVRRLLSGASTSPKSAISLFSLGLLRSPNLPRWRCLVLDYLESHSRDVGRPTVVQRCNGNEGAVRPVRGQPGIALFEPRCVALFVSGLPGVLGVRGIW